MRARHQLPRRVLVLDRRSTEPRPGRPTALLAVRSSRPHRLARAWASVLRAACDPNPPIGGNPAPSSAAGGRRPREEQHDRETGGTGEQPHRRGLRPGDERGQAASCEQQGEHKTDRPHDAGGAGASSEVDLVRRPAERKAGRGHGRAVRRNACEPAPSMRTQMDRGPDKWHPDTYACADPATRGSSPRGSAPGEQRALSVPLISRPPTHHLSAKPCRQSCAARLRCDPEAQPCRPPRPTVRLPVRPHP